MPNLVDRRRCHWKSYAMRRRLAFRLKTSLMLSLHDHDKHCRMRRGPGKPPTSATWVAWLFGLQPVTEDAFGPHQARVQATPQERISATARSDSGQRPAHHDPEET